MTGAVRLLNLARLREHPLRTGLTVVAIGAGVALFVAVLVARASVDQALRSFGREQAGPATLQVVGSTHIAGLEESVLTKVEQTEGVKAAVPLVQTPTIAKDGDGNQSFIVALGIDCRVEAVIGNVGCDGDELRIDGPVVSPSLQEDLGDKGRILTDRDPVSVGNLNPLDLLENVNDGRVVVVPMQQAQELFTRQDALDRILVVPEPGVSNDALSTRLADNVGDHNQVGPTGENRMAEDPTVPLMLVLGLMALMLGGLLAHNALALNMEERRRDLAVAGALGAPQQTLMLGALVEAGLLGLVGGTVGAVAGVFAARPLVDGMSEYVERGAGVHVDVAVPIGLAGVGVLLGCLVAVVAAIRPARRAAKADIAAELQARAAPDVHDTPTGWRRVAVFTALAGVAIAMAWLGQLDGALETWQPPLGQAGVFLGVAFCLLAVRHAAAPVVALVIARLPAARRGLTGVAADNLAGDPQRTGTMTLVVASAVYLGVILAGITESMPAAAAKWQRQDAPDTVQVNNGLQTNTGSIAARPSLEIRERLAAVPGTAEVTGSYYVDVSHPMVQRQELAVEARDGRAKHAYPVVRGDPISDVLKRGEVAIGPTIARTYNLQVGDTFELPGRTGIGRLRIGAIVAVDGELGESVTLPYRRFEELFGKQAPGELFVTPEPGTTTMELAERIRSEFADEPDLSILAPEELSASVARDVRGYTEPFWALQRSLMLVAFVGALSTLLLVGVQRRRDYGVLAAVGLAPVGLGRMVVIEAGIVGLLATVFGTVVGMVGLAAALLTSSVAMGLSAPPFTVDPAAIVLYGLLTTAAVMAGALLPAWRASRLDPATALRYE